MPILSSTDLADFIRDPAKAKEQRQVSAFPAQFGVDAARFTEPAEVVTPPTPSIAGFPERFGVQKPADVQATFVGADVPPRLPVRELGTRDVSPAVSPDFADPLTGAFQGDIGQAGFALPGLSARERTQAKALFLRDKQFSQALSLADSPAEAAQINRQRQRVVLERALSSAQSPIKRGDLRRRIKRLDDIDATTVTAAVAARPKFADIVKLKGQDVQKQRNAFRAYSNLFLDPEGNPLTGAPDFQSFTQAFISGDQQSLAAISGLRSVSQELATGGFNADEVQTAAAAAYKGVIQRKGQAYADSAIGRLEASRAQLNVLRGRG